MAPLPWVITSIASDRVIRALRSSEGPIEPPALASAKIWQVPQEKLLNSSRPAVRSASLDAAAGAGAGASGCAASGRTTSEAGVEGLGLPVGCRLATAASGGAGGSAAGGGPSATKAGAGACFTQALAPVAATGPTRGVYCSAIEARLSPVRTIPPGAGRGAVATEADTPEPRSDATGLAWSTAHADSASAALKVASAAAVLTWGSLRIRFSFR